MKAPTMEFNVNKLLSKKQVRELVGFSYAHLDRFEFDDAYVGYGFPKRIRIGHRVFWVEREIQDWIAAQIAKRETPV